MQLLPSHHQEWGTLKGPHIVLHLVMAGKAPHSVRPFFFGATLFPLGMKGEVLGPSQQVTRSADWWPKVPIA